MILTIPERGLILLIGASGSGKSTFARKHFASTEIVSSDALRAVVSDDEADQSASGDAFQLLRLIVAKRLRRGRLTVVDATNVQTKARRGLLAMAMKNSRPATAIVLNLSAAICLARNQSRAQSEMGRRVTPEVIEKQVADLAASLPRLNGEGFQHIYVLDNAIDIDSVRILRKGAKA